MTYFQATGTGTDMLIIYDMLKDAVVNEVANAGLWFAWDKEDSRLLYTRDNQVLIYDCTTQEDSLVYEADLDNRVTMVAFLAHSKVACVEDGQLFVLDYAQVHSQYVDSDVDFLLPIYGQQKLLYISDYNSIMLTDY